MNLKWWVAITSLLVSTVTLMTTICALVWGAAKISSAVDALQHTAEESKQTNTELRREMASTREDVASVKAIVTVLQTYMPRNR